MPPTAVKTPERPSGKTAGGLFAPVADQIAGFNARHGHPYARLRAVLDAEVRAEHAVLDIGCGRGAPMLAAFADRAAACYGVDLVDFRAEDDRMTLIRTDVCDMSAIPDGSIDVAYSRSVMEHLADPERALNEIARVLKPGGVYIFLTPNKWDYASIVSRLIPDSWHPKLVRWVSGRAEEDTFPTHYLANTMADLTRLAGGTRFTVRGMAYQGQYPAYLKFSRPLFWLGCRYEALLSAVPALRRYQGWIFADWRKGGAR